MCLIFHWLQSGLPVILSICSDFKSTNGKLNTQLGVDVNYNTLYHPYAYMPATGRFYRQDQVAAGNYPFINAFFNFKVQRTRVFVMVDHVNSGFMGYKYNMIPIIQ